MGVDHRLAEIVAREKGLAAREEALREKFDTGGGDGGSGMEGRLTRVEQRIDQLVDRFGGVDSKLATIEERMRHMPTRFEFYSVAAGTVAGVAGLITLFSQLGWLSP